MRCSSLLLLVPLLAAPLAAQDAPVRVGAGAGAAAETGSRLEITYLGNEGFLLSDDEHTVLIDALYGEGLAGYAVVDPELREALESARPPYDAIDVVLATHHHADHFDPHAVARHLGANPRAVFVSTPQAVARMEREVTEFAAIAARAHGVLPEEGERHSVRLLGLDVELLNLHHGRNRRPPVENLGFLLELGGRRLLHVGDTVATAAELDALDLSNDGVDIALLPCWLVAYDDWNGVVEAIAADELVVMHLPVPDAPDRYFSPFAGFGELLEAIETRHPDAKVFHSGSIDRATAEDAPATTP